MWMRLRLYAGRRQARARSRAPGGASRCIPTSLQFRLDIVRESHAAHIRSRPVIVQPGATMMLLTGCSHREGHAKPTADLVGRPR